MMHSLAPEQWRSIADTSHRPDMQELIREGIQRGIIRVRPGIAGRVDVRPSRSGTLLTAEAAPASIPHPRPDKRYLHAAHTAHAAVNPIPQDD